MHTIRTIPEVITLEWLRAHPDDIFVFGDNEGRWGKGGAAALRDEPNTYGFITKKRLNQEEPNYTVEEYIPIFYREVSNLLSYILTHPEKTFLISRLGAGLANKFGIWENVIRDGIKPLRSLSNVILLGHEDNQSN